MPSTIPSLARAIRVMNALAEGGEFSSLGLAKRLGISQSTCYRILQTLEDAEELREEVWEEVEEGEMPLRKYRWMHSDARLSDAQRRVLREWSEAHEGEEGTP